MRLPIAESEVGGGLGPIPPPPPNPTARPGTGRSRPLVRAEPLRTRRSGDSAGCGPGSFSVGGEHPQPSPLSPQPALGCPRAAPARRGRNRAWGEPPHLRRGRAPGAPGGLRSGGWGRAWARGAPPCAGASASASAASAASASAAAAAAAAIHCGPGRPSRAPSERKPRRRRRNPAGEERPRPRLRPAPGPAPEARPAECREAPFLPSPFSPSISRFFPFALHGLREYLGFSGEFDSRPCHFLLPRPWTSLSAFRNIHFL